MVDQERLDLWSENRKKRLIPIIAKLIICNPQEIHVAEFRFYEEPNDFLPSEQHKTTLLDTSQPYKMAIGEVNMSSKRYTEEFKLEPFSS